MTKLTKEQKENILETAVRQFKKSVLEGLNMSGDFHTIEDVDAIFKTLYSNVLENLDINNLDNNFITINKFLSNKDYE